MSICFFINWGFSPPTGEKLILGLLEPTMQSWAVTQVWFKLRRMVWVRAWTRFWGRFRVLANQHFRFLMGEKLILGLLAPGLGPSRRVGFEVAFGRKRPPCAAVFRGGTFAR